MPMTRSCQGLAREARRALQDVRNLSVGWRVARAGRLAMVGTPHATSRFRVPVSDAPHAEADRAQHMSARLRVRKLLPPLSGTRFHGLVRTRESRDQPQAAQSRG